MSAQQEKLRQCSSNSQNSLSDMYPWLPKHAANTQQI